MRFVAVLLVLLILPHGAVAAEPVIESCQGNRCVMIQAPPPPAICVPPGFPPILELKVDSPPQVSAIPSEEGRIMLVLSQHYQKAGVGYVVTWLNGVPLFMEDDDPQSGLWFDAVLIVRKDGHYYLRASQAAAPCQWQYVPPPLRPSS